MSRRYASATNVSVEKTRNEIERTLQRYGARKFAYGYDEHQSIIQFEAQGRHVKFILPVPDQDDYRRTEAGRTRTRDAMLAAWEQGCRSSWRALLLVIKAKLEAVEAGIVTFEEEFMAHIVLPNGGTVGQFMSPQIEHAYETGGMPALLPGS